MDLAKRSFRTRLRVGLTETYVSLLPYLPIPLELHRRLMLADSNRRVASGGWSYLDDISEAHRHGVVAAFCTYFTDTSRRVLDVGCGAGTLLRHLACGEYTGIDVAPEQIGKALRTHGHAGRFLIADANTFQPEGMLDAIVFNESLYYMPEPMRQVERYCRFLAPGGILVLCMFETNVARHIWRAMRATGMSERTRVKLVNENGFISIAKAFSDRPVPV
ncbi:MAG: class I SAM-dependent methyltransferase [Burkholderiales bacterium]|nr:class I SAM-dependent methyltransferase [Burkholderiales bacterium]